MIESKYCRALVELRSKPTHEYLKYLQNFHYAQDCLAAKTLLTHVH